ncbi:MAG: GldG family protein, partial [Anaerolineales bacterium]
MAKKSNSSRKISLKQVAPAGLWLSGLAILVAIITLIVKLLVYIGLYAPPDQKIINLILWISVGVAIVGPALYALFDPQRIREFLTGRQARHGSNALIMLVAFILILVVINAIAYQNPIQWDWTEGKQNTLAPETVDTLKKLPAPVQAIGFYTSRTSNTTTLDLFTKLKASSNGKFSYEFIDPEANPARAQQYKITQDGSVVLILQGRQEVLTSPTEQDFANALVRLMNPGSRVVYFLAGHGERDIQNPADKAYTRARTVLESKNYTVKSLNLLAENKIPADALSIIIDGPTQPVSSQEMSILGAYVAKGGSLIVMEDSSLVSNAGKPVDPLLKYLTTTWGITIQNDLVIDPSSSQIIVAVENAYGTHPITDKLQSQNMVSFFPTSCSLTLNSNIQNVQTTALITTINTSWGETNFTALQNNQVSFDAKTDFAGP